MKKIRYGNTNTYYIEGKSGGLIIDTDYAGTLPRFFRAIKAADINIKDISYALATHYHPDHAGLLGELQKLGVTLIIADVQLPRVHFSDEIFLREGRLGYAPVNEASARIIRCAESRELLREIGIDGEIIHTPSHSEDSVSVILDGGVCIVGDLEPLEYLQGYESNPKLKWDWERIMNCHPRKVLYAHANEKVFEEENKR